jgi:hypothetical protein
MKKPFMLLLFPMIVAFACTSARHDSAGHIATAEPVTECGDALNELQAARSRRAFLKRQWDAALSRLLQHPLTQQTQDTWNALVARENCFDVWGVEGRESLRLTDIADRRVELNCDQPNADPAVDDECEDLMWEQTEMAGRSMDTFRHCENLDIAWRRESALWQTMARDLGSEFQAVQDAERDAKQRFDEADRELSARGASLPAGCHEGIPRVMDDVDPNPSPREGGADIPRVVTTDEEEPVGRVIVEGEHGETY